MFLCDKCYYRIPLGFMESHARRHLNAKHVDLPGHFPIKAPILKSADLPEKPFGFEKYPEGKGS